MQNPVHTNDRCERGLEFIYLFSLLEHHQQAYRNTWQFHLHK